MPVIDFTNIQEFEVIEPGVYAATVSKAEAKVASTGSPMIALTFTLEDDPYEGRKVFSNLVLHPNALWRVKRDMIAFGWEAEDLEGEIDVEPEDFEELACRTRVDIREYRGEDRNSVEAILPYSADEE